MPHSLERLLALRLPIQKLFQVEKRSSQPKKPASHSRRNPRKSVSPKLVNYPPEKKKGGLNSQSSYRKVGIHESI